MISLAGAALVGCGQRDARVPADYPASYRQTIEAADDEGKLLIWSAIDRVKAEPLIAAFHREYPTITVDYVEIPAQKLNSRFLAVAAKASGRPDFLWSSAMDLQIKLVNDGYAQRYISPELAHLPAWANWKSEAWGTTAEPIVFLYNRKVISDAEMPRDHAALTRFLEQGEAVTKTRVASYDLATSAVGYLYLSQDQQAAHDTWRLVRAIGRNNGPVFADAEDIVRDVAAGRSAIGHNIVGSFALDQVRRNPDLGMVLPRDYSLLMSRIAVIPAIAPHPNAARLLLDFLLSRRGQSLLVRQNMPSVRTDVPAPAPLNLRNTPLRAIRVGPALLVNQDRLSRRYFLLRWQAAMRGAKHQNAGPAPGTAR